MTMKQNDLISQLLSTAGDGTGTVDATGTYTVAAPGIFYIAPAAGQIFQIHRIIMSLEDETGFKAETFGKESALTNGWTLKHERDGVVITDFTNGIAIKTNARFGDFCFDVDVKNWANTPTNELLLARFTFAKFGQPLRLIGDDSDILVARFQDTMTAFLSLQIVAQGFLETLE